MSGDAEGDFLGVPGTVSTSSVLETTDSLTPPALAKGTMTGFPLETPEQLLEDGTVALALGDPVVPPPVAGGGVRVPVLLQPRPGMVHNDDNNDDDDDESDSDEGLTMAKSTRNKHAKERSRGPVVVRPRRRGTNGSVRSTDTAKKMVVQSDATSSPAESMTQS
jgi:[calcium/calmodulin-dependent protein kinase] kinase